LLVKYIHPDSCVHQHNGLHAFDVRTMWMLQTQKEATKAEQTKGGMPQKGI
jgi:hypothetical protein